MNNLVFVALGGAIGASSRYVAVELVNNYMGKNFPYGTLFVNVLGSFVIGVIANLLILHQFKDPFGKDIIKLILITGFLGGFTTFSSFSLDTLNLLKDELFLKALLNILFNVIFCLLAVTLGWFLTNIVYKMF